MARSGLRSPKAGSWAMIAVGNVGWFFDAQMDELIYASVCANQRSAEAGVECRCSVIVMEWSVALCRGSAERSEIASPPRSVQRELLQPVSPSHDSSGV